MRQHAKPKIESRPQSTGSHSTNLNPNNNTKKKEIPKLKTQTLSISDKESIRDEIGRQRANLGPAEFDRALTIALADYTGDVPALKNRILDEVDALRSRFTNRATTGTTAF